MQHPNKIRLADYIRKSSETLTDVVESITSGKFRAVGLVTAERSDKVVSWWEPALNAEEEFSWALGTGRTTVSLKFKDPEDSSDSPEPFERELRLQDVILEVSKCPMDANIKPKKMKVKIDLRDHSITWGSAKVMLDATSCAVLIKIFRHSQTSSIGIKNCTVINDLNITGYDSIKKLFRGRERISIFKRFLIQDSRGHYSFRQNKYIVEFVGETCRNNPTDVRVT